MQVYAHNISFGATSPGLRKRRKLSVTALDGSLTFREHCFWPLGVQLVFEFYRQVVRTIGSPYHRSSDEFAGIYDAIGHSGSAIGYYSPQPFDHNWRNDITIRLLRLLRYGGIVKKWRDNHVKNGAVHVIAQIYDHPPNEKGEVFGVGERAVGDALDAIFGLASPERRMIRPTNERMRAETVHDVELSLYNDLWCFDMCLHEPGDWSQWRGPRCQQMQGEPFWDFLKRTHAELSAYLTPACKWQEPPKRVPLTGCTRPGNTPTNTEWPCPIFEHARCEGEYDYVDAANVTIGDDNA